MLPPTRPSKLSSHPLAPILRWAGGSHLQRIVILNGPLREQRLIWAYPNRILTLHKVQEIVALMTDKSFLNFSHLLAIDGGISISFENVPLTLIFHKLMPGMPWDPSRPGFPVRPRGPVIPETPMKNEFCGLSTFHGRSRTAKCG